jgi:hypothetical protein
MASYMVGDSQHGKAFAFVVAALTFVPIVASLVATLLSWMNRTCKAARNGPHGCH